MAGRYVIGIDFGTLSARALLVDTVTGQEICESIYSYPHGVMSSKLGDQPLPPGYALQHPADYIEALKNTVSSVMVNSGLSPEDIGGLGIDFTTCTLLPLDYNMDPLCFSSAFKDTPHAYVKLWKHHAAAPYSNRLNETASRYTPKILKTYGGKLSCEWAFPKIMEILSEAPFVYASAERFAEAGDWLTTLLTGSETHSLSFAGYKACYDPELGYPDESFLTEADPRLAGIIGTKISRNISPVCGKAGTINAYGAALTGLKPGTPVAAPMPDAHVAMPALNITGPNTLMVILGTSACHLLHADRMEEIPGICGCIKDGVIPGLYTYEAGQASCGDALDMFIEKFTPEKYRSEADYRGITIHQLYTEKAASLHAGESGLIVLDWFNGNRSILNDSDLSGLILGLTLDTKPEEIYRTLIEAAAFGTKAIVENFEDHGVRINRIVASGGIAGKNSLMMQIYADVLGKSIRIAGSSQSSARGSALYAAVAGGIFTSIEQAAEALAVPCTRTYFPSKENAVIYAELYQQYKELHKYFGKTNSVMHRLRAMKIKRR